MDHETGPLETLITVKDTFFPVYHHVFFQFALGFKKLFSTATFGPFTATHGYKFSTVNNFFKLSHLRKVVVTTATWQH
jgi:hypothetical protein